MLNSACKKPNADIKHETLALLCSELLEKSNFQYAKSRHVHHVWTTESQ